MRGVSSKLLFRGLPVLLAFLGLGPQTLAAAAGTHPSTPPEPAAQRKAYLDPSFGEAGRVTLPRQAIEGNVLSVLMRDDSIVIGTGRSLQRLTPDGRRDNSFGQGGTLTPPAPSGGNFQIAALAADSQGRLIVAGTSQLLDAGTPPSIPIGNGAEESPRAARVMRYLPSGALDPSFGDHGVVETDFNLPAPHDETGKQILAKPWVEVRGVAVDSQDRVILTGGASAGTAFGCAHDWFFDILTYAAFVARFTTAGTPDPTFGGDGLFGGVNVAENPLHAEVGGEPEVGPNGEVTYASSYGHCPRQEGWSGLAQVGPGGEPSPFGTGGAVRQWSGTTAVGPSGAIATLGYAGRWDYAVEPARVRVARFSPAGQPDLAFGRGGQTVLRTPGGAGSALETIAADAGGRLLLGGTMTGGKARRGAGGAAKGRRRRSTFVLVRLGAGGRPDRTFGPRGRVATRFGSLGVHSPRLLLDSQGRAVMIGTYGSSNNRGLAVARYLIG